jgi:hypothetical protein
VISSTTINTLQWYELKVHVVINGTTSQVEVWLNGSKITALSTTLNLGTTAVGRIEVAESASGNSFDVAYDNVVVSRTA